MNLHIKVVQDGEELFFIIGIDIELISQYEEDLIVGYNHVKEFGMPVFVLPIFDEPKSGNIKDNIYLLDLHSSDKNMAEVQKKAGAFVINQLVFDQCFGGKYNHISKFPDLQLLTDTRNIQKWRKDYGLHCVGVKVT